MPLSRPPARVLALLKTLTRAIRFDDYGKIVIELDRAVLFISRNNFTHYKVFQAFDQYVYCRTLQIRPPASAGTAAAL